MYQEVYWTKYKPTLKENDVLSLKFIKKVLETFIGKIKNKFKEKIVFKHGNYY